MRTAVHPRCTVVLVVSVYAMFSAAHHLSEQPYEEWMLNRYVATSNSGPMASVLNEDEGARNATISILRYFDHVGDSMKQIVTNANYAKTALHPVCNSSNIEVSKSINFRMRLLQLGQWKSDCITELRLGNVENLWNNIAIMQDALQKRGPRLISQTNVSAKHWNKGVFTYYAFNHSSTLQKCEIRHIAAFRARGVWAVLASLTSHPKNSRRIEHGRHYLAEYITNNRSGGMGNLQLAVNNSEKTRVPATTTESSWGGVPASSIFLSARRLEKNPAVRAAVSSGARFRQQAEDSKTKANISIMVLSCIFALVPVALFADVGAWTALMYALATDIVSCLPLAIKGIELIQLSTITIAESSTLVYGLDSASDSELDLGVSEAWVAKCTAKLSLYKLGVTFLIVALAAMVIGVMLEVWSRARLARMKEDYMIQCTVKRNAALTNLWGKEQRCNKCNCYAVNMVSSSVDEAKKMVSAGILSARLQRRTLDLVTDVQNSGINEFLIEPASYGW